MIGVMSGVNSENCLSRRMGGTWEESRTEEWVPAHRLKPLNFKQRRAAVLSKDHKPFVMLPCRTDFFQKKKNHQKIQEKI